METLNNRVIVQKVTAAQLARWNRFVPQNVTVTLIVL